MTRRDWFGRSTSAGGLARRASMGALAVVVAAALLPQAAAGQDPTAPQTRGVATQRPAVPAAAPAAADEPLPDGIPEGSVRIPSSVVTWERIDSLACYFYRSLVFDGVTYGQPVPNSSVPGTVRVYVQNLDPEDPDPVVSQFAFPGPRTANIGTESVTVYSGTQHYLNGNYLPVIVGNGSPTDPLSSGCYPTRWEARKAAALENAREQVLWSVGPVGGVPTAEFGYSPDGTDPHEIHFTSLSTDVEDEPGELTYAWDFGDGNTSTEQNPVHTYNEGGQFTVTLTVTDTVGNKDDQAKPVDVDSLILDGAIFPFPTGDSIVKEGEAVDIRLRVENHGDDPLTDVQVAAVTTIATDAEGAGRATVTPKPGGETLSGTLGIASEGTNLDFADYHVDPTVAGTVRVAMAVTAKKPGGTPVEATITWDLEIRPAPLRVQLTAREPGDDAHPPGTGFEFALNENDHENKFEIEVEVTNQGDETVETIDYLDGEAPVDFKSLLVDEEGNPIPGVAITPLDDPVPPLPDHDLDPGESVSQTFLFEGIDKAHTDATVIVLGRMGADAVSGRGTVNVKVLSDVLVEFGMKDSRGGQYASGTLVRLEGTVENVSEDTKVGVVAYPTTEGNAGNGNVFDAAVGGRTPESPYGFVLEPGDQVDLAALLVTMEFPVASDASVSWEVRVWKHEIDEETGELTKTRAADTQVKILDDDGYSDSVTARILPTVQLPDTVGGCAYAYFGCGVLVGLDVFAQSLFDLIRLSRYVEGGVYGVTTRLVLWAGQFLGEAVEALMDSPEARQRFIDETVGEAQSLVDTGALVLRTGARLPVLAAQSFGEFLNKWENIAATGNWEELQFELGRIAGENPDLALEAFLAVRWGRKLLTGASELGDPIRVALDRASAEHAAELGEKLAAAERTALNGGESVARSGVFKNGDDLSVRMMGDYWSADPRDVDTLFDVAESEDVLLTFASRGEEVTTAIRSGKAWPLPSELNISPTDGIDILYLGYREDRRGLSDLVSPPADFPIRFTSNDGYCCFHPGEEAVAAASREWVARKYPQLDEALAQRVASRLQTRVDEFTANYERFIEFSRAGPGAYEVEVGRVNPSDYLQAAGRDGWRQVFDDRTVRLTPYQQGEFGPPAPQRVYPEGSAWPTWGTGSTPNRLYWEVDFDALGTGDFRPVTGGVELVAVTELDGTRIADAGRRAAIYDKLQQAISMSNGELDDFVATGRATPLRKIAEGTETAVTVGPGRVGRASNFVERRSVLADTPNSVLHVDDGGTDFVLVAGYEYDWVARALSPGGFTRRGLYSALNAFYRLPLFFLPSILFRYVSELSQRQVPNEFARDGQNIRGDGDGGLEAYDPDAAPAAQLTRSRRVHARAGTGAWVPISVKDALALGPDPEVLEISPMTSLAIGLAGDSSIQVSAAADLGLASRTEWFAPGDRIIINPGGANEERRTVVALGSLVLDAPLAQDHIPGEMIVRDIPLADPQQTPTEPTTTTTTPGGPADPGPGSEPGDLARTGASIIAMLFLAGGLLIAGALLRRSSRRLASRR